MKRTPVAGRASSLLVLSLAACAPGAISSPGGGQGDDGDAGRGDADAGPGDDEPDGGSTPLCAPNSAPETPVVTAPLAGRRDVVGGSLVLEAGAFDDVDGDAHVATEWEIWQVAGDSPVQVVWRALIEGAELGNATLADGEFLVGDGLAPDRSYQAVVRFRGASEGGAACDSWSEWSTPRRFLTDDGSTAFFAEDQIRDLYLTIPQATIDALDAQSHPPGCVPYERESYVASMTFEGVTYPGIGLKTKGGCGSSRGMSGKPSFKISLEWDDPAVAGCPAERRVGGQKSITLQNDVQDRSYIHQSLAYQLYRALGVPAPRANFMRVHVNGALWGLYTNLESIDRTMLRRWFDSKKGMMYEGTYWCDVIPENAPASDDHDSDTSQCFGREFHTDACDAADPEEDPTDFSELRRLMARLAAIPNGQYYPAIEQVFDFDRVLTLWAIDAYVNNWDGFIYDVMNNYRIYRDPSTDLWSVIPSGTDQTFTTNRDRSAFQVANVVARRCLAEADCKAAFAARLDEVLAAVAAAGLPARAIALRDLIAADVLADPRREFSYSSFLSAVDATIGFVNGRAATIEADLTSNGF